MTLTPSAAPEWVLLDLDQTEQEYTLFDSVICEKTDIAGFPIYYYVKLDPERSDYLYGEYTDSEYSIPFRSKLLYEPSEEPQVMNVFGITSDDTIQYMQIPKTIYFRDIAARYLKTYCYLVDYFNFKNVDYRSWYCVSYGCGDVSGSGLDLIDTGYTPMPGDCILTLWNKKLYEIAEVSSEQNIFQGKKLIWDFIVRPYRHSEESDSATYMMFDEPAESDFPEINITTETQVLSAYGENKKIENESDTINRTPDSSVYGY